MSEDRLPTAEKFYKKNEDAFSHLKEVILNKEIYDFYAGVIQTFAIEFAKTHVREALQKASERVFVTTIDDSILSRNNGHRYRVEKDSILNSYPLENIK